jgi:branched-chain amino acid transport system permease protein
MKVVASAIATFLAALGGAFLAMWEGSALPTAFTTFQGLIWLAVLVTIGVRSVTAAAVAGLAFTMLPNVFSTYLPNSPKWAYVPALLFGLGAIALAVNPEGVVAQQARQLERLLVRAAGRRAGGLVVSPVGDHPLQGSDKR